MDHLGHSPLERNIMDELNNYSSHVFTNLNHGHVSLLNYTFWEMFRDLFQSLNNWVVYFPK